MMRDFFLENENKLKRKNEAEQDSDLLTLSLSLPPFRSVKPKQEQEDSQSNYLQNISPLLEQPIGLTRNPNPGVADVDINIGSPHTSSRVHDNLISHLLEPSTVPASVDLNNPGPEVAHVVDFNNPEPEVDHVDINIDTQHTSSPLSAGADLNPNLGVADVDKNDPAEASSSHAADVDMNMGIQRSIFRNGRSRRCPSQGPGPGKSLIIRPPFRWATNRRACVYSRRQLVQKNILSITGTVQCKRCDKKFDMAFNLEEKLTELCMFIERNKATMHQRAPRAWLDPVLPRCEYCGQENSARPFLTNTKKKDINWLFLLLGQMLGCCTLDQLKYFCKHTQNHRTGAKDRVLYSTYMGLCQQLIPDGVL